MNIFRQPAIIASSKRNDNPPPCAPIPHIPSRDDIEMCRSVARRKRNAPLGLTGIRNRRHEIGSGYPRHSRQDDRVPAPEEGGDPRSDGGGDGHCDFVLPALQREPYRGRACAPRRRRGRAAKGGACAAARGAIGGLLLSRSGAESEMAFLSEKIEYEFLNRLCRNHNNRFSLREGGKGDRLT